MSLRYRYALPLLTLLAALSASACFLGRSQPTATPAPPTNTPTVAAPSPTAAPTAAPTLNAPTATPTLGQPVSPTIPPPSPTATATLRPTAAPTPGATEPAPTLPPTVAPTPTPGGAAVPTPTPIRTATPRPVTAAPPTPTPTPTSVPAPTPDQSGSDNGDDGGVTLPPTPTRGPTSTPTLTPLPGSTATPRPTLTPRPTSTPTPAPTPGPTPTPVDPAKLVNIVAQPPSGNPAPGSEFDVVIQVNAGASNPVDTLQVYLNYDMAKVEVTRITNGVLMLLLQSEFDNVSGHVNHAATINFGDPVRKAPFTFATVRFRAKAAAGAFDTTVSFAPPIDPRRETGGFSEGFDVTGTLTAAQIAVRAP